ncbi:hypothetical protein Ancab_007564 [Ancistrocladus abbreviatus]
MEEKIHDIDPKVDLGDDMLGGVAMVDRVQNVWEHWLGMIVGGIANPQLVCGDFNDFISLEEKRGFANADLRPNETMDNASQTLGCKICKENGGEKGLVFRGYGIDVETRVLQARKAQEGINSLIKENDEHVSAVLEALVTSKEVHRVVFSILKEKVGALLSTRVGTGIPSFSASSPAPAEPIKAGGGIIHHVGCLNGVHHHHDQSKKQIEKVVEAMEAKGGVHLETRTSLAANPKVQPEVVLFELGVELGGKSSPQVVWVDRVEVEMEEKIHDIDPKVDLGDDVLGGVARVDRVQNVWEHWVGLVF